MGREIKSLPFFLHLLLFVGHLYFSAEARPFHALKISGYSVGASGFAEALGALKKAGSGDGGGGHHKFVNVGIMKNSGPSPGAGHGNKFNYNNQALGGVKKSGPSPGGGHTFTTFGEGVESGSSPGNGHSHVKGRKD